MPTQLRGQGSALANVCAMITNFFAPQIVYSKIVDRRMPFILMGIVSLLAAILAIFLPETAGIKLPDTVEEAEVLFKRKKILTKIILCIYEFVWTIGAYAHQKYCVASRLVF